MGKIYTAGQAKDDIIIRRIRCVCWINKVTDRHSEFISFPRQKLLRECASIVLLCAHCLCISGDYQAKILPFFLNNIIRLRLSNGDSFCVFSYRTWTSSDVFGEICSTKTWVTVTISVRLWPCRTLRTSELKQGKAQFICLKTFDFCTGLIVALCNTNIKRSVYKIPKLLLWSYNIFSQFKVAQLCEISYGICRQKSTNKWIPKFISGLENFCKRLSVSVSGTEEHMTGHRAFHNRLQS